MSFTWRRGEHESFFNKIKKFNSKIGRAIKNGYNFNLPDKINYKKELNKILKEKYYSRREFNNTMKKIDIFLEKDSLDINKSNKGAKIPNWELNQINKVILPEINRKRMIQKKKFQEDTATDRGKPMKGKPKVKDVPDLSTNKIKKMKFNWKNKSMNDFEKFKETLWEYDESLQRQDKQMYKNYKKAIYHEMNTKDAWELRNLVNQVPVDFAIRKIYNDLNLGFGFVYSKAEYDNRLEALKQGWTNIIKDYNKTKGKKAKKSRKR